MLLFAFGLYELFISEIDEAMEKEKSSNKKRDVNTADSAIQAGLPIKYRLNPSEKRSSS